MSQTFYEILEVHPNASPEVIRAAYKSLMQRYHPDKNPGDPYADSQSQKINEAYECLSDPTKRAAYDEKLAAENDGANKSHYAGQKGDPDTGGAGTDGAPAGTKKTDKSEEDTHVFGEPQANYFSPVFAICIVLSLLGLFDFPHGYFQFLHLILFCTALYAIYLIRARSQIIFASALLVILYNPVFPVTLDSKAIWFLINLLTLFLFYRVNRVLEEGKDQPFARSKTDNVGVNGDRSGSQAAPVNKAFIWLKKRKSAIGDVIYLLFFLGLIIWGGNKNPPTSNKVSAPPVQVAPSPVAAPTATEPNGSQEQQYSQAQNVPAQQNYLAQEEQDPHFGEATKQVIAKYPELNPSSTAFNGKVADDVLILMKSYESQGLTAPSALKMAADRVISQLPVRYGPTVPISPQ